MSTFLDDLFKKMKTAPHVGVPTVTNPKLPTNVEKATAEYAARQKEMPNFHFGTGTPLERLQKHMANAPHPTPTRPDPKFKTPGKKVTKTEMDEFDIQLDAFIEEMKAKKTKRKQDAEKAQQAKNESETMQ
jgi:hypothetical protein